MGAPPTEQVLAGLTESAHKARAGKVRWRSFVPTPIQPGETVTAVVRQIAVCEMPVAEAHRLLDERAWRKSECPRTPGAVVATDRRLMVVGNRQKVLREWPWERIASVRMSPTMRALLVQEVAAEDTVFAIIRRQFLLLSSPDGIEVATHLISLEGAWLLWQGKLDLWLQTLPARFPRD